MLSRLRSDDGFTMVELLIAIVILAVITVPLADTVIGVLRNQDDTADRLALSHDVQLAASYFAQDVAEVGVRVGSLDTDGNVPFQQSVWANDNATYDAGGQICGTSGVKQYLRLMSDHATGPGSSTIHVVAYYLKPGTKDLYRLKCAGGTTLFDAVVAHDVDSATIRVRCFDQVVDAVSCEGAEVPQQVNLTFSATRPSVDAYPISLVGQRRQT